MRLITVIVFLLSFAFSFAQTPIVYHIDMSNIQHHELGVHIQFPSLPPQPLVVRMPTSSPGRYAEHNFAKNVYDIKAFDVNGESIPVDRTGINEWTIAQHGGQAQFKYTLFANRADGTYSKVDNRKLHLNMPATFAYGVGMEKRPVELQIPEDQQPEWKVATQLKALGNRRFRAPNYYYFFDSPTMISDIRFRSWTVEDNGRSAIIEMAFMTPDPDSLLDTYADWTKKIVARYQKTYNELPAFDYEKYTFLCAYNSYVSGDGMEHRNSTICTAPVPLEGYSNKLIRTISHEFFHAWNVERLRPASLEPFNFDEANLSNELWFAEGFTSYFDDLTLARVGIINEEEYINGLNGSFNYVLLRPGSRFRTPIGMSQCAPFVDAASSIDEDNFDNTFISYYSYGAVLGLGLDLQLRRDFNTTMDAYMRLVWERYGRTEIPYNIPDLQTCLADLIQNDVFAKQWFSKYIYGNEMPDYQNLLADFGVQMIQNKPDSVGFYGLKLKEVDNEMTVIGTVYKNNPLYEAGIENGDILTKLNGKIIASQTDWDTAIATLKIGQTYNISYRQNGLSMSGKFIATTDPSFKLVIDETAKKKAVKRRMEWLK